MHNSTNSLLVPRKLFDDYIFTSSKTFLYFSNMSPIIWSHRLFHAENQLIFKNKLYILDSNRWLQLHSPTTLFQHAHQQNTVSPLSNWEGCEHTLRQHPVLLSPVCNCETLQTSCTFYWLTNINTESIFSCNSPWKSRWHFTVVRHLAAWHHFIEQDPERPDVRFHGEALVDRGFRSRPTHRDLRVSTGRIHTVLERETTENFNVSTFSFLDFSHLKL